MFRQVLFPTPARLPSDQWTYRGLNPGRLEAFSDSTFSFALTLLIITLDVPKSYEQLLALLPGFLSFAACFALLTVLWLRHVSFFRRYGLHDTRTVAINTGLLALVLFYLYPLKFLMNTAGDIIFYVIGKSAGAPRPAGLPNAAAMPRILGIYLIGFGAVTFAFALLYHRALQLRVELKLSAYEEAHTRDDVVLWGIAALSALAGALWSFFAPAQLAPFGSFILFSIRLTQYLQRRRRARQFPV